MAAIGALPPPAAGLKSSLERSIFGGKAPVVLPNRLMAKSITRCSSSTLPAPARIPAAWPSRAGTFLLDSCKPFLAACSRHDRSARFSQPQYYRLADAASAAGDNGTAALQRQQVVERGGFWNGECRSSHRGPLVGA
jgi:hypothetical protein